MKQVCSYILNFDTFFKINMIIVSRPRQRQAEESSRVEKREQFVFRIEIESPQRSVAPALRRRHPARVLHRGHARLAQKRQQVIVINIF